MSMYTAVRCLLEPPPNPPPPLIVAPLPAAHGDHPLCDRRAQRGDWHVNQWGCATAEAETTSARGCGRAARHAVAWRALAEPTRRPTSKEKRMGSPYCNLSQRTKPSAQISPGIFVLLYMTAFA